MSGPDDDQVLLESVQAFDAKVRNMYTNRTGTLKFNFPRETWTRRLQ